jgi:isoquinoline 1-oxidoreductase alpha subunit
MRRLHLLIDGHVTRSCVTPVVSVAGTAITTIEAIEQDDLGQRVVAAWVKHQVPQCGYCQSGQVMAATSLLKQTQNPTDEEIRTAMSNLCRCGTYNAIRAAVHELAGHQASQQRASATPRRQSLLTTEPGVAVLTGVGACAVVKAARQAKAERSADALWNMVGAIIKLFEP